MTEQTDMRALSRARWTTNDSSYEAINTGSLMRIADATELMAKRHAELVSERDNFKASAEYWLKYADSRDLSIRALKGQVTKLKWKLAELERPKEAQKE